MHEGPAGDPGDARRLRPARLHVLDQEQGRCRQVHRGRVDVGDPDEILEKVRGVVALSLPTLQQKDGVVQIRMTAYFDDINALKVLDDGEGDKAKPKLE